MIVIQIEICKFIIFCIKYIVWLCVYLLYPTAFSTRYALGRQKQTSSFCDLGNCNTFASILAIRWVLKL
jgi:hypothetical protein